MLLGAVPCGAASWSRRESNPRLGMVSGMFLRACPQSYSHVRFACGCLRKHVAPLLPGGVGRCLSVLPRPASVIRRVCTNRPCWFSTAGTCRARLRARSGGEGEVANIGVGFYSCDAIDDGCRIILRRAASCIPFPSKPFRPLLGCPLLVMVSDGTCVPAGSLCPRHPVRARRCCSSSSRSGVSMLSLLNCQSCDAMRMVSAFRRPVSGRLCAVSGRGPDGSR